VYYLPFKYRKDRNYYTFVILTFIFGFFGIDHFYLRSFSTGTQKLLVNIFGLGLWYVWDLIQILSEGDKVRTDGLSSPFDWIQGIGRGVFANNVVQRGGGDSEGDISPPEKSYLLYTVLAVLFGWVGADKFYIGETVQGFAKIFLCFNLFLFLLGWFWVAWDAFNAFFRTDSILQDGISPPTPLNYLFSKTPGTIFIGGMPPRVKPTLTESVLSAVLPTNLPAVPDFNTAKQAAKEILPLLITPPIVKAIESAGIPDAVKIVQSGGGEGGLTGPGAAIAGVLVAVVLAGGLKGTYDFITKVL